MIETKIYSYYAFGYNYYLLRFSTKAIAVRGEDSLASRIDDFFEKLRELDLRVTEAAAIDLTKIRSGLNELDEKTVVTAELVEQVTNAVNKLDTTLDAELGLRSAFIVTPKRFPLEYLLGSTRHLFAADVFDHLPDICKFDFSEACRSIAFGLPTASAFHLMRGTEGVLRFYYCSIVKRNRIEKQMWGEVITELKKRRDAPPRPLLDSLDNIRVNFRNPTQHPEARYDIDEAQDLLALSIDIVNRMIRDLSKRNLLPTIYI